jgi:hypothetical protein
MRGVIGRSPPLKLHVTKSRGSIYNSLVLLAMAVVTIEPHMPGVLRGSHDRNVFWG